MITKENRIKIVRWIRSGAPLKEGVLLYSVLPSHNKKILKDLKENPEENKKELIIHICKLINITRNKFKLIINKYNKQNVLPGLENKTKTKKRPFREQWKFLSDKNCPQELKLLASDKITAWEKYTAAHKKLYDCKSLKECYNVAHELIENLKNNRLIFEEFNFYKKYHKPLREHQIWDNTKRFETYKKMNIVELVHLSEKTLPSRIWRIKNELKKGDKPQLQGEREKRLEKYESELLEIKKLINV